MAARKVSVTSVTPASKVKATPKAQQSRTRNLVMGIAAATPVGRAAKAGATVAKAVSSTSKAKKVVKPLTEPKSAVKTKPAAKQVGNPPDLTKVGNRMIESIARSGGGGRGSLGKKKDARVVNAKGLRKSTDASARGIAKEPARLPKSDTSRSPFSYNTVKINSQRNLKKK
jgi:hypothetical protein